MEARPRKRTGYMRGEVRSGGECASATEMPAATVEAANVNAAATTVETAAMEAATTVETTATAMKAAPATAMKAATTTTAMASPASRAGIRRGRQQHRASERGNA
jgi:hypothetical protein